MRTVYIFSLTQDLLVKYSRGCLHLMNELVGRLHSTPLTYIYINDHDMAKKMDKEVDRKRFSDITLHSIPLIYIYLSTHNMINLTL